MANIETSAPIRAKDRDKLRVAMEPPSIGG